MNKKYQLLAGIVLLLGVAGVQAQQKPGLWVVRSLSQEASQAAQIAAQKRALQQMPPAVREALKKQGIDYDSEGNPKMCLTREMLARLETLNNQHCPHTVIVRNANVTKSTFVCQNPPVSGESTVTFTGDTAYTAQTITHSMVNGKKTSTTYHSSGQWLQADCGGLKPVTLPAPAKK